VKTNVKIRDARDQVIGKVTEHGQENHGLNHLSYDQSEGSLLVVHNGSPVTISGSVRGDLTIRGDITVSSVKCGGSLNMEN
jgi:hypothetical protein